MTQVTLGASESQYYGAQPFYSGPGANFGFQVRAEDQAALDQLGPQGVETGKKALRIATDLVKGVFPSSGPVVRNGQIQTKWGSYALPNPQDAEVVDKLLQATRDLIQKMTITV